jgi:hypothetical protein
LQTGTYTIQVFGGAGNVTATVYNIINNQGTMTASRPPVNFTDNVPGETPSFTFAGIARQPVSLVLSNCTNCPSGTNNNLNINYSSGVPLLSGLFGTNFYNTQGTTIGPIVLPTTGQSVAQVAFAGSGSGNGTLQLLNFADPSSPVN